MKRKFFLLVLLASIVTAFGWRVAVADDDGDSQNHQDDCDIEGSESLDAVIVLFATGNAPSNAVGIARIESEIEEGTNTATLTLKTLGLDPGVYSLSAVRSSDTNSVDLGSITVSASHHDGEDDQGEDENDDSDEDQGGNSQTSMLSTSHIWAGSSWPANQSDDEDDDDQGDDEGNGVSHSEDEIDLPPDLNTADIAQLILSDANGNPVLIGDMLATNAIPGCGVKFQAKVRITSDLGAKGTAQVKSTSKKGKQTNRFTMTASGVPADSEFDVQVNGTSVDTVKSNKKGRVLVKKLPASLLKVRSVKLMDSQGRSAASAKF